MPAAYVALEAQIWPVMESLAKAAVAEICKVVDAECVEMRLEIRRGQSEIESLNGKLRDLRKALRNTSLATVSPVHQPSLDSSLYKNERGAIADGLHQVSDCEKEEDKSSSPVWTDSLPANVTQGRGSAFLSCRSEQPQSIFSISEKRVEFQQSQIPSGSMISEGEDGTARLGTTAVKVESDCHSIAECIFEGCQSDQKLCTNSKDQMMGESNSTFGSAEDFQPQSHYSAQSHRSEEASHSEYDALFSQLNAQRNGEASHFVVKCKTEPEEEPIGERANELAPCEIMDSDPLSWPFFSTVNFEAQDCSKLQDILHTHTDPQLFHVAGTSEMLPSCSIKLAVESRVKQAKARKIQDRLQARTFKQHSGSWSTMITKVKALPKTNKHKPLFCSFCPKSFYNASDLKRHQRIHTGEKPFGCTVCGKRFALRGNLITHERAHSGSKPYTCQQCGKSFAHGSNLTAHLRVHTGEKPFCCSQCGKTFAWHFPFKRHMNMHGQHGQKL